MTEGMIKGALAGLAYGLLLGPLFFLGLQIALKSGLHNGLALAAGAFMSDAVLAVAGWWSSGWLLALAREDRFQSALGAVGAFLIIGFGISAVWPHKIPGEDIRVQRTEKRRYSFIKGFALNTANPSNWLFWLGLATAVRAEAPADIEQRYTLAFLGMALLMVLSTDLAKVVLAWRIGNRLRPGLVRNIVRVAGVILIGVGGWALVKSVGF